jgi:hypothetical protein
MGTIIVRSTSMYEAIIIAVGGVEKKEVSKYKADLRKFILKLFRREASELGLVEYRVGFSITYQLSIWQCVSS